MSLFGITLLLTLGLGVITTATPAFADVTVAAPACEPDYMSVFDCDQSSDSVATTWYLTPAPSGLYGSPYTANTSDGFLYSSCDAGEELYVYDSYVSGGVTYTSQQTRFHCFGGPPP
jgi:hypothetical protein